MESETYTPGQHQEGMRETRALDDVRAVGQGNTCPPLKLLMTANFSRGGLIVLRKPFQTLKTDSSLIHPACRLLVCDFIIQ